MEYIESEKVELKEKYTDNIIKEIVSFLNGEGGTVYIGVKDNGEVVGVSNIDQTLRKLSDIITNQIEPNPQEEIRTELLFENQKTIISINISKGKNNIYCQKKYGFSSVGCTIRIGTTCKEMTPEQIKTRYEKKFMDLELMLKQPSSLSKLTFRQLKIYYSEINYHIDENNFESNFNLRNDDGKYNLLAELLADKNNIPLIFVKFNGVNKVAMSERYNYGYQCILTSYWKIKNKLQAENICSVDTTARPRIDTYLFDFDCVNEALINALVHNEWTITEPQISIFSDRIEILSHGGLPNNMTKEQFFKGISNPRNKTLMRIFLSLNLCEHTGHGIPTIINKYGKQAFEIQSNYIKCIIPFNKKDATIHNEDNKDDFVGICDNNVGNRVGEVDIIEDNTDNKDKNVGKNVGINKTQQEILSKISKNTQITLIELSKEMNLTKRTIERNIKVLKDRELLIRKGTNRNGNWVINY